MVRGREEAAYSSVVYAVCYVCIVKENTNTIHEG